MRGSVAFAVRLWLAFALSAIGAGPARADDPRVTASVDAERIGSDDTLVLTVRAEGDEAGRVSAPSLGELSDFRVVSGPSVSTQFQWVNGRSFAAKSFTYVLLARRTGRLRIPALALDKRGQALHTQPIDVEVVEGSLGGAAGRRPPARRGEAPDPSAPGSPQVRIEAELDHPRAYVGQQVTLTYLIRTQVEITGLDLEDVPTYPGFWVEELKVDPNPVLRRVVVDGEEYSELVVMKKSLFPTRPGRLEIPPVTFSLGVRAGAGDPFGSLFFGRGQTVYRKSPARVVEAEPIPEAGRPASFAGAVGRFRLSVSPDRQEAKVNDAIALKVRIDGEGNVRPVTAPSLPRLVDFKAYDPRVDEKTFFEGDRVKGSKSWDYVLLPLAPGAQEIPPLEFSYFDPHSGRFQTLRSHPIRVQVARADAEPGPSLAVVQPREVEALRADIHHLKPAPPRLGSVSRPLIASPAFAAALALPALGNALLLLGRWRRGRLEQDRGSSRRRRARREARRALRAASGAATAAAGPGAGEFYETVSRALRQYVADKLDRAAAGLTQAEIERALEQGGASPAERLRLLGCLEACDRGRFAPAAGRPKARLELLEQARAAIDGLERRL